MEQELLIAIIAGLCGMLGWGLADFFAKKTVDEVGDIVSLVWAHVFGTLGLILVAIYYYGIQGNTLPVPNNLYAWGGLTFFGALQAIVYFFAYKGFGKGQIAVLNPVFASYSGLAALISIFVFGEAVNSSTLISLFLIFLGVVLVSIDPSGLKSKNLKIFGAPGLKEVGLASLLAAFWQLYWEVFIGTEDWVIYTLLMYAFMTLTAFIMSKFMKAKLTIKKTGIWKFLMLIGACEVIAYLGLSLGFSATSYTSIVIILAGAFSLPTIILARIFLKERLNMVQTLGGLTIVAGVILLALF
jgi:drug/metabolite transporter (DMT)-like permease